MKIAQSNVNNYCLENFLHIITINMLYIYTIRRLITYMQVWTEIKMLWLKKPRSIKSKMHLLLFHTTPLLIIHFLFCYHFGSLLQKFTVWINFSTVNSHWFFFFHFKVVNKNKLTGKILQILGKFVSFLHTFLYKTPKIYNKRRLKTKTSKRHIYKYF